MRRSNVFLLVGLVAFAGVMIYSFSGSLSSYTDLATAQKTGQDVHVVGRWVRQQEATYDPTTDRFSFYLQDSLKNEALVVYADPKPANFERAEQVVVVGRYKDGAFQAKDILMKCPSKYQDDQLVVPTAQPPAQ